jgi:hypothetical protein
LYLIRGPFKKDGRDYVVVNDNGKRRIMSFARYLLQKETGEKLPPSIEVHHIDGNKENNELQNLEKKKYYKHKEIHHKKATKKT